ncbi:MAG: Rieske (2Fe-2S) protein [bacterium]
MNRDYRCQTDRMSGGIPAPRESLQQNIERITPQNSFNHALPVGRGTCFDRRGFLRWGTLSVSLLSVLGFARIIQAFLSAGREEREPTRFMAGLWDEFPRGSVVRKRSIFVVHDQNGIYALKGSCPHLGCGFRWIQEKEYFECPCHGSRFERSGHLISGPAGKPLQHVLLTKNMKNEIIADVLKAVPDDFRLTQG